MFTMKLQMSYIRTSATDIEKTPPVRKSSKQRSGIFVEAMVEVIFGKVAEQQESYCNRPVAAKNRCDCFDHIDEGGEFITTHT